MVKAIRGAITVSENTAAAITAASREMLAEIISKNGLRAEEIIAAFFTATGDLTACYPAAAAREMGLTEAALMCAQEMSVDGSLRMCLRVCVLAEIAEKPRHTYLGGAKILRPDLI